LKPESSKISKGRIAAVLYSEISGRSWSTP
jgi:hypothetical protein